MSDGVSDNIDAQWVGLFDGELTEVPFLFTFPFPAISDVRIVANEDHDSTLVIFNRLVIRCAGVRFISRFPGDVARLASKCDVNGRHLRLFFELINAVKDLTSKKC